MILKLYILTFLSFLGCSKSDSANPVPEKPIVLFGDPFVLNCDTIYYLYGTNSGNGIEVYKSKDLLSWSGPCGATNGLAMHKNDVWGEKWFWAPEVYHVNGKFYMYYSGDEHICVAVSDSPLGPFKQEFQKPMIEGEKSIDNSLYIDDNGKPYLFFDRFNDGLNIWVTELEDNLLNIKPETMYKCINVSQPWEEVWPRVNEGSFVFKRKGVYYMTYSANSYESPFYGVGFATATNITGPWTKYNKNPILQKPGTLLGIGHSAMFTDNKGQMKIVYHSHYDAKNIHPRKVHISNVNFVKDENYSYEIIEIDLSDLNPLYKNVNDE